MHGSQGRKGAPLPRGILLIPLQSLEADVRQTWYALTRLYRCIVLNTCNMFAVLMLVANLGVLNDIRIRSRVVRPHTLAGPIPPIIRSTSTELLRLVQRKRKPGRFLRRVTCLSQLIDEWWTALRMLHFPFKRNLVRNELLRLATLATNVPPTRTQRQQRYHVPHRILVRPSSPVAAARLRQLLSIALTVLLDRIQHERFILNVPLVLIVEYVLYSHCRKIRTSSSW